MSASGLVSKIRIQAHLSFRIVDTSLDPDRVSDALSIAPTRFGRRGEPISKRVPKPRAKGFWILDSAQELARSEPFNAHAIWLLDRLEPVAAAIQRLAQENEVVDLSAGIFTDSQHGGPLIDASVLRRLGALDLTLCLDLYPDIFDDAVVDNQ